MADDGIIIAKPRSGYAVRADIRPQAVAAGRLMVEHAQPAPLWSAKLRRRYADQRNIQKPANWHEYPFPFVYGQPDPKLFPTPEWRECSRAALAVLAIRDWSSDLIDGDDAMLIDQLQRRILPRRGIFAAFDQIMITVGAQHALYMLADLLTDETSVIGIEDPGYPDARNILTTRGARLHPLPVDKDGISIDWGTFPFDLLCLTPSHQCPTSATLSLDRREAILDAASAHDFVIIEDDYESELNFAGAAMPALKSLDRSDRVIYLGSLSKTLAPGLRLGYIVGAKDLIAEARALRRLMLRHPPANNQRASALFIERGYHDAQLRRLTAVLAERATILTQALTTYAPVLRFVPPRGGSSLWVKGPPGFDAALFAMQAQRAGVLIEPGHVFFATPYPTCPWFRLGYSSIPVDRIEPGIRRLTALLDF